MLKTWLILGSWWFLSMFFSKLALVLCITLLDPLILLFLSTEHTKFVVCQPKSWMGPNCVQFCRYNSIPCYKWMLEKNEYIYSSSTTMWEFDNFFFYTYENTKNTHFAGISRCWSTTACDQSGRYQNALKVSVLGHYLNRIYIARLCLAQHRSSGTNYTNLWPLLAAEAYID